MQVRRMKNERYRPPSMFCISVRNFTSPSEILYFRPSFVHSRSRFFMFAKDPGMFADDFTHVRKGRKCKCVFCHCRFRYKGGSKCDESRTCTSVRHRGFVVPSEILHFRPRICIFVKVLFIFARDFLYSQKIRACSPTISRMFARGGSVHVVCHCRYRLQ